MHACRVTRDPARKLTTAATRSARRLPAPRTFWSIAYDIRCTGQHRTAWDCASAEDARLSRRGAFWLLPGHHQRPVPAIGHAWPLRPVDRENGLVRSGPSALVDLRRLIDTPHIAKGVADFADRGQRT